jgi:hypothetical protein
MALALFGDPQLALPRRAAHGLALTAPATVAVGGGGIPVHVTEDGIAKQGVVVTAYREVEGMATAVTDAQGDAIVPFSAVVPGDVSLTARQLGSPVDVDSVDAIATTGAPAGVNASGLAFAVPRPNPSAGDVLFSWTVPAELAGVPSRLTIHDLAGRLVRAWELESGRTSRGVSWDGRDAAGGRAPAGLYVARLAVGDRVLTRPVIRTR